MVGNVSSSGQGGPQLAALDIGAGSTEKEMRANGEEDRLRILPVMLLVCCWWRSRGGGMSR